MLVNIFGLEIDSKTGAIVNRMIAYEKDDQNKLNPIINGRWRLQVEEWEDRDTCPIKLLRAGKPVCVFEEDGCPAFHTIRAKLQITSAYLRVFDASLSTLFGHPIPNDEERAELLASRCAQCQTDVMDAIFKGPE